MLEFGRTWRARVQRRLMKARARCWETCFLRLVSMTSRHWRTISTPSLVAPKILIADRPFVTFMQLRLAPEKPKINCHTVPNHLPNQWSRPILLKRCSGLYCISSQFQKFFLSTSYVRLNKDVWHWQGSILYASFSFAFFTDYNSGYNIFLKEILIKDTLS